MAQEFWKIWLETSTLPVWELNSGSARKGKDIDLKLGVPRSGTRALNRSPTYPGYFFFLPVFPDDFDSFVGGSMVMDQRVIQTEIFQ